jgi:hypothetical protein
MEIFRYLGAVVIIKFMLCLKGKSDTSSGQVRDCWLVC